MSVIELIRHQQQHYARFHRSPANLRLHLVAVPMFQAGTLLLLLGRSWWLALAGIGVMTLSLALQRRGHQWEDEAVEPFRGPLNALLRIGFEQWLSFPRFVLQGGWRLALGKLNQEAKR